MLLNDRMKNGHDFANVSLLITHYNRSHSLERLLLSFDKLNCKFGEIVVSDDGSKPEHYDYILSLQSKMNFKLVSAPKNSGLGNNINKGQDAVKTPLTLYVQEDFIPKDNFPESLVHAVELLKENPQYDIARFYAYFTYPFLKQIQDDFCEMNFKLLLPGYRKFYVYSDHPHLRHSTFFEKFGRYSEGIHGDKTEYNMMMSFLKSNGKAICYRDINGLFEQKNTQSEPSTLKRTSLRESNHFLITNIRHFYRHVKFNFDYIFS